MDVFVAIVILAILIEKLAEVVKAIISPAALPAWTWFVITAGMGVMLCILFEIDLLSALGFVSSASAALVVGQIITGIAVGAGSGFVHDIIDRLKTGKE